MKLNEEQRKRLARRRQMQREGKGKTLKEAMASAGGGLVLQDILMAEERKAREVSEESSKESAPEDRSGEA